MTLLGTHGGIPLERIAALRPDLILATNARDVSAEYGDLRTIAPTLTRLTKAPDSTRLIAAALGKQDAVDRAVSSVSAAITHDTSRNPKLSGRTFSAARAVSPSQLLIIKDRDDGAVKLMG